MKNFKNASTLIVSLCLDTLKNNGADFALNNDTDSRGLSNIADTDGDLFSFECEFRGTPVLGLVTPNVKEIEAQHNARSCAFVIRIYKTEEIKKVKGVLDNEGFFTRIPDFSEIIPIILMTSIGCIAYNGYGDFYQSGEELEMRERCFSAAFDTPLCEE